MMNGLHHDIQCTKCVIFDPRVTLHDSEKKKKI